MPAVELCREAWSIVGPPWFSEPEPRRGTLVGSTWLDAWADPHWIWIDVTTLISAWVGGQPNRGLLLKLPDEVEENAGPLFASADHADPALRPWLEIWFDEP